MVGWLDGVVIRVSRHDDVSASGRWGPDTVSQERRARNGEPGTVSQERRARNGELGTESQER